MDLTLIIFASGVVFGGACAIIAANKNRDPLVWFAVGFFFSLVALVVIATLSPSEEPQRRRHRVANEFASNPKDPERPWLG